MTKQNPRGQYMVVSYDRYKQDGSNFVPAGRYDKLSDAIEHCKSVTYMMCVIDAKAETQGFVYENWNTAPKLSPWGPVQHSKRLAEGVWFVSASGHGGIWLSNERVQALHEIMGYNYPTFCRDYHWYEEDCDWTIPVIAFRIEDSYEEACKQLRSMSNRWLDRRVFKQAHDALVKSGHMLNTEKVQQTLIALLKENL